MLRQTMTRLHDRRARTVAGLSLIALLGIATTSVSIGASAKPPASTPVDKPDPCDLVADVPGHATGLHSHCVPPSGGSGVARADFNNDGIGDLAIGVPDENIGTATNTGGVNIIYGSAAGLTSLGNQFFTQDSPGVPDTAEKDDLFGHSLAAIDINGDGFSDLAVGVPQEDGGEGRVQMFMGSAAGLVPGVSHTFASLVGRTCGCQFGSALAWGDFDHDNRADLAIGMRTYEVQNVAQGAVLIMYGRGSRLVIPFPNFVYAGSAHASFGVTLAAGDRNGDGYDDLAIGAPLQDFKSPTFTGIESVVAYAGAVYLYDGSHTSLEWAALLEQDNVGAVPEYGDQFGRALAFGDFDGDGRADLAIGTPEEDVEDRTGAGAVSLVYGVQVPGVRVNRTFTQNSMDGTIAQRGDHFGAALAAGDFDGDGHADLAIGVPGEDFGSPYTYDFLPDAGMVHVLYGYAVHGLPVNGRNEGWHQDTSGVPGVAEAGDQFGAALSAWNFGFGSQKDLAIGVPYEDVNGKADAGAIVVLYGAPGGLSATGAQIWHQDSAGIADVASTSDRFGSSMY